jgi:hypothetical protein
MNRIRKIDPTSIALVTLALLMLAYANGCAALGGGQTSQAHRLAYAMSTYTSTVEWLANAANAGLIDESEKQSIRAIRLQADAALTAADAVISSGGDATPSLDTIDKLLDELIAAQSRAVKKAKG